MCHLQHLEGIAQVKLEKSEETIAKNEEIEGILESNKNKSIKIRKMLMEATQIHELLTNSFMKKN
jgi:hypothetical protein